jgi:transposase
MKFLPYNPEQGYLLPPSVKDVRGEKHLCFFIHRVVERLDLRALEEAYGEEGRRAYAPALMVKVWLYAYARGITSSRRLEERIREDLAFRYLAGGAEPDYWTLNDFRRRHRRGLNDVFTQGVEAARELGMGKLGHVAIDTTRVAANASRQRVDSVKKLRQERAKIRRRIRHGQQACDATDPNETPGTEVAAQHLQALEQRLEALPQRLQDLNKTGLAQVSRTDPDSRFLKEGRKFTLGYTGAMATSEDHLIVEQQVRQAASDKALLLPVVDGVRERCGAWPQQVSADSGFYSDENLIGLETRQIDGYVPDPNTAYALYHRPMVRRRGWREPAHQRMVQKLRTPQGRETYRRRKAIVEPVFGVLKQQRDLRRFRLRGLAKVAVEITLAATAFNLSRRWRTTLLQGTEGTKNAAA